MSPRPSSDDGQAQKKRKHKKRPLLERVPAADSRGSGSDDGNSRFARALGSTDYATREKGVQALSLWLTHKQDIPELDMMRLWKGLFFCFWHSDKVPVQTELAQRLAALLPRLSPGVACLYWGGMLATMRREWSAMDHHRLDKFLMLVRKFVAAAFDRFATARWGEAAIADLTVSPPLAGELVPVDSSRALGLSYHLADVWLQELRSACESGGSPPPTHDALLALLEPWASALERSGEASLLSRIGGSVFGVLAADVAGGGSGGGDGRPAYVRNLEAASLAAVLFERGAAPGLRARNREALYEASKQLERAVGKRKRRSSSGGGGSGDMHLSGESSAAAAQPAVVKKRTQQQQQQQVPLEHKEEIHQLNGVSAQLHQATALPKQKKPKQQKQQHLLPVLTPPPQQQQQQPQKEQKQKQSKQLDTAATQSSGKKRRHVAVEHTPAVQHTPQDPTQRQQQVLTPITANGADQPTRVRRTAAANTPGTAAADAAAAGRKRVVINLRRNIAFAHGAPLPPPDVRSPPATQPKGPALKRAAGGTPQSAPARAPASRLGPWGGTPAPTALTSGTPVAGVPHPSGARLPVTPSSVPRLKAAAFF